MKAQNTIEFSVTLGLMMLFTLFMSTALSIAIAKKIEDRQLETLSAALREVAREIDTAIGASHGYRTIVTLQTRGVQEGFNLSLNNGGEIVITNLKGYSLIKFLDSENSYKGQICSPTFEIWRDADYGIGMCCGSCDDTFPNIDLSLPTECKTNESLNLWDACTNITAGENMTAVRSQCDISMRNANISLFQQSLGVYRIINESITNYVIRTRFIATA
jgi:hypothetical protein